MSGMMNYPPEIVDAVAAMQKAAQLLDQEMADLQRIVGTLVTGSKGDALAAVDEVQRLWQQSGLAHNETLNLVARAAGDSYQEMTSFDSYLANQLR